MADYVDYHRFIIAWALASVRMAAAFLVCPALSDSMIPGTARRVVVLSFGLLVTPLVLRVLPPVEQLSAGQLLPFVLKETMIGFFLGFFAAIPFWVAENVGNLIDNQRGATMGEVYSPLSGAQVSTLGIFFTQIVSTLFFVSEAVLLLLAAVYHSYSVWPVFASWPTFSPDAPLQMLGTLDGMLRLTVVISAPIVILMFLATVGLGFVNRTAPQLNVFFLSMPIKSALGIAMLVIYLPFIMDKLMYAKETAVLRPVLKLLSPTN